MIHRWRVIVLPLILVAGALASMAGARENESDTDEVRQVAARFGDCVVKRDGYHAKKIVLAAAMDDVSRRWLDSVSSCLLQAGSGTMRFPATMFQYALADSLIRHEFAHASPIDPSGVPPIDHGSSTLPAKATAKEREKAAAFDYAGKLGECVVRSAPAESKALIMSGVTSTDERKSFDAMLPTVAQCMTPGLQLTFSKSLLRGTIALTYYRLAYALRMGEEG